MAAVLAYWLRHGTLDWPFAYVVVTLMGVLITSHALHVARVYQFDDLLRLPRQLNRLAVALPAVMLLLLALGFFTKTSGEFSRAWVALWFALSFVGLVAVRVVMAIRLRRLQAEGRLTRSVAIIGAGEPGQRLVRHLVHNPEPGVRLVGIFDDRRTRIPREIEGQPVRGTVDDLVALARRERIDRIVIALPWSNKPRLFECMHKLKLLPVSVHLCPDTVGFRLHNRGVTQLGGVPMFSVAEPPLTGWSIAVKAVEDRVLATLILIAVLPTLLAIAALVKLDGPGPMLFRQRRYGFNNNVFDVFKFRTMVDDPRFADGAAQATRDDPRVTEVGAFLRRHSLDELPQLVNVLKGEMSIVGPRPHAVPHNERYAELIDGYLARHKVKPGITGWAQVNGLRGETDTLEKMEARVEHDLFYVENWSLLFDLRIVFLTLFVGMRGANAY